LKWQAVLIDPSLNANLEYKCKTIKWDVIRDSWAQNLWKGRDDIINMSDMYLTINRPNIDKVELDFIMRADKCSKEEATRRIYEDCTIHYGYTHDNRIYKLYTPTFFGVYDNEKLIGVNSGHRSKKNEYRSRGLWVDPDYRGRKIGKILLQATINKAVEEGCDLIWSLPRESSMPVYNSVGFDKKSDWITKGVLYGPNCIAIKNLK
jgi:GNAT superfamily N-acetyltransferase